MANIKINTGTGPVVAADLIGTSYYQQVKLMVGTSGSATFVMYGQTAMADSLPVVIASNQSTLPVNVVAFTPGGTQSVSVVNAPVVTATVSNTVTITGTVDAAFVPSGTQNVSVVNAVAMSGTGNVTIAGTPVVTASQGGAWSVSLSGTGNVTVAGTPTVTATISNAVIPISGTATIIPSGTQTVTVAGTPTVTASQGGTWNIATISTLLGTIAVSGGGGGAQYAAGATDMGATGTGTMIIGLQSGATTGRAVVVTTTGGLIIGAMPAVGGGQQYPDGTVVNATGTGTLLFGVSNNTARSLVIHTTGGLIIATMPSVGGGSQYQVDTTAMGATATGTVILGMQSGATTGRGLAVTATGGIHTVQNIGSVLAMPVLSASGVTIASIATGSVSVINTPTITVSTLLATPVLTVTASANPLVVTGTVITPASGTQNVILVSGTVSTVLAMPVLSASGVTIASLPIISGTGLLLGATTAIAGAFVQTHHASNWSACVISTTSGGGHAILKTSGAHTLYVTDLMVSVDVPMAVSFYSSSADQAPKLTAYLATKGGFAFSLKTPIVLTSAQSLVFIGGASGSCAGFAAGYTVT